MKKCRGRIPVSGPIILFRGCEWACSRHQLGEKTSVVLEFGATSGVLRQTSILTSASRKGNTRRKFLLVGSENTAKNLFSYHVGEAQGLRSPDVCSEFNLPSDLRIDASIVAPEILPSKRRLTIFNLSIQGTMRKGDLRGSIACYLTEHSRN